MSDSPLRPTTVQLFYKKNIQLAPYNNAELGLIITLEALPDAALDPAHLAEALDGCWASVQTFVHAQEDRARARFAETLPEDDHRPWTPKGRGGRASFHPVNAQVTGDDPFPDRGGPVAPAPPVEPEQGTAGGAAPPVEPDAGGAAPAEDTPPAASVAPPQTPEEAQARYFARYGLRIGGDTLRAVRTFFVEPGLVEPGSIEDWVALATRTRDELKARDERMETARAAFAAAQAKTAAMAPVRATQGRRPTR